MKSLRFAATVLVTLAAVAAYSTIEGTYVIAIEGMPQNSEMPEMTIGFSVDDEGNYSVVLGGGLADDEQEVQDVSVKENEFSFKVVGETPMGEVTMSFKGNVEDGKMSGTMSSEGFDMKFTGKLKEEDADSEDDNAEETAEMSYE